MDDNPQECSAGMIEVQVDNRWYSIEFVRHRDHHYYMYLNGCKTDVKFSRHLQMFEYKKFTLEYFLENIGNLSFGQSLHNKLFIERLSKL